jgi:hypothetical protein
MRRFDKNKNMRKANLLAESRYLESKGLIKENDLSGIANYGEDAKTIAFRNLMDAFKAVKNGMLPKEAGIGVAFKEFEKYASEEEMNKVNNEYRDIATKYVNEDNGIQKTDEDIKDMAAEIVNMTSDIDEQNHLIVKSSQGSEDIQRRLTSRVQQLENEFWERHNTSKEEQEKISLNMIMHFGSAQKAYDENEKMLRDYESKGYKPEIKILKYRLNYISKKG